MRIVVLGLSIDFTVFTLANAELLALPFLSSSIMALALWPPEFWTLDVVVLAAIRSVRAYHSI